MTLDDKLYPFLGIASKNILKKSCLQECAKKWVAITAGTLLYFIYFSETRVKQVCVNQGVHVLILHQTRSYQNPHLGQCCKKWDRVQPLRLFRAHKLPINAWTFSPQVVFYGISKSLGYSCCLAFWKPEFQVYCNSVVGESVKLQNLFCF